MMWRSKWTTTICRREERFLNRGSKTRCYDRHRNASLRHCKAAASLQQTKSHDVNGTGYKHPEYRWSSPLFPVIAFSMRLAFLAAVFLSIVFSSAHIIGIAGPTSFTATKSSSYSVHFLTSNGTLQSKPNSC